jgi:hypothetical protein
MWINNLLKMPIVKLIAMFALLYYIFDKTKDDPRTISYHLNKENIGKSIEIANKNINNLSAIKEELQKKDSNQNFDQQVDKMNLSFQDIRQGIGSNQAVCGSEVFIEYSLMSKNSGDVLNKSNIKFEIGSKFNEIIEKTLIGMTAGGIRVVDIPHDFRVGDQRYDDMIQNSNMVYKISLLTVSEEAKPNAICYE